MSNFNDNKDDEKGIFEAMMDVSSGPYRALRGEVPAVTAERQAQEVAPPSPSIPQEAFTPEIAPEPVKDITPEQKMRVAEDLLAKKEEQKLALISTAEQEKEARDRAQKELAEAERVRQIRMEALNKSAAELNTKVQEQQAEIDKMEPKSFWKKADTGDKIKMALAVMLGAIGQGLSGSRINPAVQMMNKVIADDLELQKEAIGRKIDHMKRTKAGLGQIAAAKDAAIIEFKQRKAKTLDLLENELAGMKAQTQNVNMIAAIDEQMAKIQNSKIELQQAIGQDVQRFSVDRVNRAEDMAKIDPKVMEKMPLEQQREITMALKNFNMKRPFGEGQNLKGDQAKSASFLTKNDKNIKQIEEIEAGLTPNEFNALKDAMQSAINRSERKSAPIVGQLAGAIETGLRGSAAEVMEAAVPGKGGRYYKAMLNFVNDQTRYESGAAISPSEFVSTMEKYFPTATTQAADMQDIVRSRRDVLKSHKAISGVKQPLFFESN